MAFTVNTPLADCFIATAPIMYESEADDVMAPLYVPVADTVFEQMPRFENVVCVWVKLENPAPADKSFAPAATVAATHIRSLAFAVVKFPEFKEVAATPFAEFDPSVGDEETLPVHSSTIMMPSDPPIVSVIVTTLFAVV